MPRYYFNLKDGRESLDDVGSEFPDIHAARREAVRYSGDVLRDGAGEEIWAGEIWKLGSPTNRAKGNTFFTLNLSAAEGEP